MKNLRIFGLRSAALLLVAAQFSCGGSDSQAPPVATTLTENSATSLSGTAGTAVTTPPSVLVKDQNGNPMAGVSVTFVASGGGSVTGSPAVTNSSGVATVTSWTLGTTVGTNTVIASTGSLAPITFTATSVAGSAAAITKTAGDAQTAPTGTAVAVPPSVTVRDANGNPVNGITVIFAVASGGGTLTGGSQVTNASGVATVGSWTLGAAAGTNTLTATAAGLPAVTFTATATVRAACSVATAHTIGTTSNGTLATSDCLLSGGEYVDYFATTVSTAGAYIFTDSSTSIDAFLLLYGPDQWIIGVNDDGDPTSRHSRIKALIPSASYLLGATSYDPAELGDYKLSSAVTSAAITGCEEVFVARGITTNQSLQTTDCLFNQFYSDDMWIFLRAGQSVTISMNSTEIDAWLELWRQGSSKVAENDTRTTGTTDAQIVYLVPADDFYLIVPTSHVLGATGAYTLIIQ
jgi:hypothetical protein